MYFLKYPNYDFAITACASTATEVPLTLYVIDSCANAVGRHRLGRDKPLYRFRWCSLPKFSYILDTGVTIVTVITPNRPTTPSLCIIDNLGKLNCPVRRVKKLGMNAIEMYMKTMTMTLTCFLVLDLRLFDVTHSVLFRRSFPQLFNLLDNPAGYVTIHSQDLRTIKTLLFIVNPVTLYATACYVNHAGLDTNTSPSVHFQKKFDQVLYLHLGNTCWLCDRLYTKPSEYKGIFCDVCRHDWPEVKQTHPFDINEYFDGPLHAE